MGYVYKITNTINNKSYIGISIHEPEKRRIKDHLSGNKSGSRLIARAVKKYGKDVFTYEILEANVFDEFLPDLEVAYIANHNTISPHGYNLDSGGSHKMPSEETRRKMSEAQKGRKHSIETRRKMSKAQKGEKNHQFGKKPSAEHRRKISDAHKGRVHSTEHRHKISKAHKGKNLTADHRRKVSEALKGEKNPNFGKKHSAETRRKMFEKARRGEKHHQFGKPSKNRSPEYASAHTFFLLLPPDIPVKEKRKLLFAEFPNVKRHTIYKWIRNWSKQEHL